MVPTFHDTYGGVMLNVFGYVWAMKRQDFRSQEEREKDGLAEHATMTETSVTLALKPSAVASDYRSPQPQTGHSMTELQKIAAASSWAGYFGAPGLASEALGHKIYGQWLQSAKQLVLGVLRGDTSYTGLPRYSILYGDDPADAAAVAVNDEAERRHQQWLARRASKAEQPRREP